MRIMKSMAISEFKAKCLGVLEQVRRTRRPILVTRFGIPVAEVGPAPAPDRPPDWFGAMRGTGKVRGDIVSPASSKSDWEVLRS